MSTAGDVADVAVTVGQVLGVISLIAKAFELDEKQVIQVAASQIPALAETPPDAGVEYDQVVEQLESDVHERPTSPGRVHRFMDDEQ